MELGTTVGCQCIASKIAMTRAAATTKDKSIRKGLPPEVFVLKSVLERITAMCHRVKNMVNNKGERYHGPQLWTYLVW